MPLSSGVARSWLCVGFYAGSMGMALLLILAITNDCRGGILSPATCRRLKVKALVAESYKCHCKFACPDHPLAWRAVAPPSINALEPSFNESVHRRDFRYDCPLRPGLCRRGSGGGGEARPLALLVVPSAPGNRDQRDAVRETWSSESTELGFDVVFLLAMSLDDIVRRAVDDESRLHGDLVVADFTDSYDLLTVKSVAILRWASLHCPSARYLVKVDDDMFVSLPHMRQVLLQHANVTRAVIGHRRDHFRVIERPKHKWRNPFYLRHYGKEYPPYVSGTTYVIAMAIVPELFAASQAELFDRMEDVFVTGICTRSIGNVTLLMHKGFTPAKRTACQFVDPDVITGHHATAPDMKAMWQMLRSQECYAASTSPAASAQRGGQNESSSAPLL